ncbi:MAG: transcription elongation factor NusA [Hadesarchaea archaeon]|nr:transcription elongation factor NusA [Hadesarchaea archaeon]
MQTPICKICLKSGILCQGCSRKIEEGKISKLELNISLALYELSKKHKELDQLIFKRAVDSDGLAILVVGTGQIPLLIGRRGRIVQELENILKTKVRIVEEGSTEKKLIQDLLTPADVLGINILYTKSGDEYRVRVPRQHMRRLPMKKEKLEAALSKLTNKNYTIIFE